MDSAPGLFGTARQLFGTVADIGLTRLELASVELEEERLRLAQQMLLAALTLFTLGMGLLLASLLVVVVFWDSHRVLAVAAVTGLYLAGSVGLGLVWRAKARAKPRLFSATLAELQRDRAAWREGLS